jgi:isocitrate/isopropylmalate dehydrogenase
MRPLYTVACLARHGIGPEVMAVASRAVEAASRAYGFSVHEEHVPFGADALMRFGHPFPLSSRRAVISADAVLVASEGGEALDALQDELDLRASIARVRFEETGELSVLAPLSEDAWEWTLEKSFSLARFSRGRVALVGVDSRWTEQLAEVRMRHDGLELEQLQPGEAMRALALTPRRFDVVVCPPELGDSAGSLAACTARGRTTAWGRLAAGGPGVFGTEHGADEELAGQDVADPASMLLAAALMLGEGLGQRSAAATLSAAAGRAREGREQGSTQALADLVVAQVPVALSTEFQREAV